MVFFNHLTRLTALLLLALLPALELTALTPSGTVIRNQASATFRDADGVMHTIASNTVETLIQPVAGLVLTRDQQRAANASDTVVFSHVIKNTGNGPDSFSLSATNLAGDQFDFDAIALFADNNQDGSADDTVPITATPGLNADDVFYFVVVASVPGSAASTDLGRLQITATSYLDSAVSVSNTDQVVLSSSGVVSVNKSLSLNQGTALDAPLSVTLSYQNTSSTGVDDLVLIDALPAGMTYVPGSARWSKAASLVLTDAGPADVQGTGSDTLVFCAYHDSCTGLAESSLDDDAVSTNQVTAVVHQIAAGETAHISFEVMIDAGLSAGTLQNIAEFEFDDGGATLSRQLSNAVGFEITELFGVVVNGSLTDSADGVQEPLLIASTPQMTAVQFDNRVWNTGNVSDTYDLRVVPSSNTFPPGTIITWLHGDGQTPLVDTNGNGLPDTGPMATGSDFSFVLKVQPDTVVSGDNGGAGYAIEVEAISGGNPSVSNSMINQLAAIEPSSVDLTNHVPLSEGAAAGAGIGPETSAVSVVTIAPGNTGEFLLYVNNTSQHTDSYVLSVSTDATFATDTLPPGWQVRFIGHDEQQVTATDILLPSQSQPITAVVSIPAGQQPSQQSFYFRVLSATTGAADIKHDQVVVPVIDDVVLEPSGASQLEPGSSVIYAHWLQNTGNTPLNGINLSTTDSRASAGWTSVVYQDLNENGSIDATETAVSSIGNLAVGQRVSLLIKVFAPADAAQTEINRTTLLAEWASGSRAVVNESTVNTSQMSIVKEQASDVGCDNTLDSAYSVETFQLEPGNNCVHYRLTATNLGSVPLYNAIIRDATPAFTRYLPAAQCSVTPCTITEPSAGGSGPVTASIATLTPGQSVQFSFAVILE